MCAGPFSVLGATMQLRHAARSILPETLIMITFLFQMD